MSIIEEIQNYYPGCEQEEKDKALIVKFLTENDDAFSRENTMAHMTASAWVLSPDGQKVVMCYHNIYKSWSWTGGHADGDTDLLAVAMREAEEETGLKTHPAVNGIFSLESLTVDGHIKHGEYVSGHLHFNVTYLLQAEGWELRPKTDENSAVKWFTPEEALAASTEPWMVEWIYRKLAQRAEKYMK